METLTTDRREQLANFGQQLTAEGIWNAASQCSEEARIHQVQDSGTQYEILARRYLNSTNQALKVSFWETGDTDRKYLGAIGYHHVDALPYCKSVEANTHESTFYEILGSISLKET